MKPRAILPALALLLGLCAPGRADLVITVQDGVIPQAGSGAIDVLISGSGDLLSSFNFEFRITTAGLTRLEFVDPQSDEQLGDASYVFAGNSLAVDDGVPIGNVSTTSVPNDTFIGGDSTADFGDVPVTSSRLLVRLNLTAVTGLAPVEGDTFTISLVPLTSPGDLGDASFFVDSAFEPIAYTSTSGTVTIGPAAAVVPEPSTLALALVGLGLAALAVRRR